MQINDFLTIEYVASFLGCVVATNLIVQFMKDLPHIKKIPTKYFTFLVAFTNITICTFTVSGISIQKIYLLFINAILLTFTCTGGYDFTYKKVKITEDTSDNKDGSKDEVINLPEVGNVTFTEKK